MKNIILIAKREFLIQVKKKSFVILTILAPILLVVFTGLVALMQKANETKHQFLVVDESHLFENKLRNQDDLAFVHETKNKQMAIQKIMKDKDDWDGVLILPQLKNKNYDQFAKETQLLVNKKINIQTQQKISEELAILIKKQKINNLGLTEVQIRDMEKGFALNPVNIINDKKLDNELDVNVKTILGLALMYVTFMFIIMYGTRILRSVLEEKNNRVVEIIISSVKPFELMYGKMFGVTMVALTQFGVWIVMTISFFKMFSLYAPIMLSSNMGQATLMLQSISNELLNLHYILIAVLFLLYFMIGYIFYSSIFAAIGSAVNSETESQQLNVFLMIPLMLGMYGSFSIINNPEGPMVYWISMIPFTSPLGMMVRIPFGVPFWQIIVSISILIISTIAVTYLASKIYRVGILSYGNKASLKEIIRWIKHY